MRLFDSGRHLFGSGRYLKDLFVSDSPYRMVSCCERLWISTAMRYPGFTNQMVLEAGCGTDTEFNLDQWKNALRVVTDAQPGCRVRLRGFGRRSQWVADGPVPRLRVVDGTHWDGYSPKGAGFLRDPLYPTSGPVTEILLVRGRPARVIIRTEHSAMDGAGTKLFVAGLFSALRGETPTQVPLGPPTDFEIAATQTDQAAKLIKRNSPVLTGKRHGQSREITWCRATISEQVPEPFFRFTMALARYAQVSRNNDIRFSIPIDLRRHRPDVLSNANLMVMLSMPVGSYLDSPDPVSAFREGLLKTIKTGEHARPVMSANMVKDVPLWLISLILRAVEPLELSSTTVFNSAIVSNLGLIDTSVLQADGFMTKRIFFVPPTVIINPAFATITGTKQSLELCIGMPETLANGGRLQRLMDAVVDELKRLPHRSEQSPCDPRSQGRVLLRSQIEGAWTLCLLRCFQLPEKMDRTHH